MSDFWKKFFFGAASVALVGLIVFGKYKLATAKLTIPLLFLGGLVFAASTPQQAAAKSEVTR